MNRFMRQVFLEGVRAAGCYDPAEVLGMYEESMTFEEYYTAEGFLNWVIANDLTFGHGNLEEMYAKFKRTKAFKESLKKLRRTY